MPVDPKHAAETILDALLPGSAKDATAERERIALLCAADDVAEWQALVDADAEETFACWQIVRDGLSQAFAVARS